MSEPTPIDLPVGLRWIKLVYRLGQLVTDSTVDADPHPDLLPKGGTLTLTASPDVVRIQEADGRWRSVDIAGRTYTIRSDGELVDGEGRVGVWIPDPASLLVEPQGYAITAVVKPTTGKERRVTIGGSTVLPDVVDLVAISSVGAVSPTVTASFDARLYALEAGSGVDVSQAVEDYLTANPPAGGGGGVTDHGLLTGLEGDDHPQYALADGTRGAFAPALGEDDNYVTDAEKAALHSHANQAALDAVSGVNTGDQDLSGLATTTALTAGLADKADATHSHVLADVTDYAPPDLSGYATTASLSTVATSGAYADLMGAPTIPDSPDDIGAAPATQLINAQTGAYTLTASDAGKLVTVTSATAVDVTVPSGVFSAGQRVDVLDNGAERVTFVAGSGMTLGGTPSLVSRAQHSAHSIVFLSATQAVVVGDLGAA